MIRAAAGALTVVAALGWGVDDSPAPRAAVALGAPASPTVARSPLDTERAIWASLDPSTRAHYCTPPRADRVTEYADAIAEGEHAAHPVRLARAILREGCPR